MVTATSTNPTGGGDIFVRGYGGAFGDPTIIEALGSYLDITYLGP